MIGENQGCAEGISRTAAGLLGRVDPMRQAQKLPSLSTIKIADRYEVSFNDEAKRVTLSEGDRALITHEHKQSKIVAEDLSLSDLQEIEAILQQKLQEISTPQSQKASLNKQDRLLI